MPDAFPKTILVIDDTEPVRRFAEDFFRKLKFEVFAAPDGFEGLQVAYALRPDLILLDLMMPHLDGFKTLQLIKSNELTKNIPVVGMTAYSDRVNASSASRLGAEAVITKPLTEELLFRQLKAVFGDTFVKSVLPKDIRNTENPFGMEEDEHSDVARSMVEEFVRYFAEQLDMLECAVRDEDVDTIRRITHGISGTGGSFGYGDASALANRLNETVHASPVNWREAEELLIQLKNRLNR